MIDLETVIKSAGEYNVRDYFPEREHFETERKSYSCRNDWLAGRKNGIGASEAAAILGLSPWQTPIDLWKLKTGRSQPPDLSLNAAVEQGNRMEPALRAFFRGLHPQWDHEYQQFDILFQKSRPWLFATLDGEYSIRVLPDAFPAWPESYHILEIKTATPANRAKWEEWKDRVPQYYYVQILHQLLATGYKSATLFACLFAQNGDKIIREYNFKREDCKDDMDYLLAEETKFWNDYVLADRMPPQLLTM